MNKVGIYFAFWEPEWKADYVKYVRKVKRLGFDVLEVAAGGIAEMTSAERERLTRTAEDEGITLSYCIGLPPQYDIASENSSVRRAGIDYVKNLLLAIREMKGQTLGGIIYACWPGGRYDLEEKKKMRARSLVSLKEILPLCEDCEIDYCLEVVNRFEQCILNTAQEGVAFVEETGSPRAKLLLDSFHMNIEEDDISSAIRSSASCLGHFHIGENNRRLPGQGKTDWQTIFSALKDIDYRGKIVMEPFIRPGGQVGEDIKIFRDLSCGADEAKMDALAEQSCRFVKSNLK